MTSTLPIRSYSSALYSTSPYSSHTPRAISSSVTQGRSHRLAGQDQRWNAPQSQAVAGTFTDSGALSNSTYESSSDDTWTEVRSLTVSNHSNNIMSAPVPNNSTYNSTFSCPDQFCRVASTPRDYQLSHSPPQNPPNSSVTYASASNYRSSPCPTWVVGSRTFSNPFSSPSSQPSPFTRTTEIPPAEPNYTSIPQAPAQQLQFPPTAQYQTGFDTGYPTSFGGAYRPAEGPASTHSELTDVSQVQPSYSDRQSYYPTYYDRRGSTNSSVSKYHQDYHTPELQNNDVYGQSAEQDATTASPCYSASPVAAHAPSPCGSLTAQESMSPRLRGVGSTEAVRRRVGIMLRTQKCQQDEQIERTSIKYPSDGLRDKLSPTSDVSEVGKEVDLLAKYKAAYERVRIQRNFYERATSSLVHQVKILGGDPMQSSKRASEGEDLDPKRARILVASLQGEVETLRNKLIQTQKELYSHRQSRDDSSRSCRGGYFLSEEDDKAPLSAAPVTINSYHRRR